MSPIDHSPWQSLFNRYLAGVRDDLAERLLHHDGAIRYAYDWSLNRAD